MIKVETDELGNQYLALPWLPDKKIKYKSLALSDRLKNECFAGAFGEISKDGLLYWVDTAKTRAQVKKKSKNTIDIDDNSSAKSDNYRLQTNSKSQTTGNADGNSLENVEKSSEYSPSDDFDFNPVAVLSNLKGLYAGFPVVAASSIPQGAIFFLAKGGVLEIFKNSGLDIPTWVNSIVPIVISTLVYWLIRTSRSDQD